MKMTVLISAIGNITEQRVGKAGHLSAGKQSFGAWNLSVDRQRGPFAQLLRSAAVFALAAFWLPAVLQAEDLQYSIDNGQVTITGYNGPGGDVTVPDSIQALPVTSIGDYAFAFSSLTSLTIGSTVTNIGASVFVYSSGLISILVDAGNLNYSSLDGVLFNKDRTTLITCPGGKSGDYVIPNSVTSIGDRAFSQCESLTSVTIPNSVTSIGNSAFIDCSGLVSLTIPDSVTSSIGDSAFVGCDSLASVTVGNGVTSIGKYAFDGCVGLVSVTFGNSVTGIEDYAFFFCSSLASVTIPDSVTSIGDSAFGATSLTNVTIGRSVTNIVDTAFSGSSTLLSFMVDAGNANYSSLDGVLFTKDQTTLVQYPGGKTGAYVILNNVTSVGNSAFFSCTNLLSVTIPNHVTSIGDSAFSSTSLTNVIIPESVTSIGGGAFAGCASLANILVDAGNANYSSLDGVLFNKDRSTLVQYPGGKSGDYVTPNSVTSIGGSAFTGANVTNVTISDSVISIGDSAFAACGNLAHVIIGNSVSTIGASAFLFTSLTNVTIPNSVTSIGDSAFQGCENLANVTIGNSVTTIGEYAFADCPSLASVIIPDSVTSIGNSAFSYCTGLTNVTIGNSVTGIVDYAFYGCTNLASVIIPDSVTSIGDSAFQSCSNLASVAIGSGLTNLVPYAFTECPGLRSFIVAPGNPNYSSLEDVLFNKDRTILVQYPGGKAGPYMIPLSVTSIETAAFYGCASLTSVTISDGVTNIPTDAFADCSSLASVIIPESLTSIDAGGAYAFAGCLRLRSVYFMGNAPSGPASFPDSDRGTVYYQPGTTGWDSTFGGRPAVLWVAEADLDGDGMSNQREFLAGTDPSDAQSLLAFERSARADDLPEGDKTALQSGQFGLYFQTIPGKSYEIQFTERLGGQWSKAATVAAGGATQRRVVLDTPATTGFYRLLLVATQ